MILKNHFFKYHALKKVKSFFIYFFLYIYIDYDGGSSSITPLALAYWVPSLLPPESGPGHGPFDKTYSKNLRLFKKLNND